MSEQSSERKPGKLNRGHVKFRLIRALADGSKTQSQLARDFGVVSSAITQFKQAHRAEIEAVRADLNNEFAGLVLANKANRLAELEADIEAIGDGRIRVTIEGEDGREITSEKVDPALLRAKHAALKAIAEELGQLPSKLNVSVDPVTVRYEVSGVPDEDLGGTGGTSDG